MVDGRGWGCGRDYKAEERARGAARHTRAQHRNDETDVSRPSDSLELLNVWCCSDAQTENHPCGVDGGVQPAGHECARTERFHRTLRASEKASPLSSRHK